MRGRAMAQLQVPATAAGYAQLLAWAVEGTRHYALGLARHLAGHGQPVTEIDAARHVGKRRAGKSDAIDAVRAARELLARPHPAQVRADGDREALRLLMIDRDNAVASGKTARTVLTSVLVTAPASLREQLRRIPPERRARACAELTCPASTDRLTRVVHQTLIRLGQRAVALTQIADDLGAQIAAIAEDLAPGLVAAEYGLGALTAAQILLSWSYAGQIRNEAAFAMLSGTAPVPVSSGPHQPPPGQPPRRPSGQPRPAHHGGQPHAQPPAHLGLHPAPPHRRQDRPRDPPLHQALLRPSPLPSPQPELTNIGASDRVVDQGPSRSLADRPTCPPTWVAARRADR